VLLPLLRAFAVFFQVLNTAEQKEIIRVNRERQARAPDAPRAESISEAVARLQQGGMSADQVQTLLDRIAICPTLTAHPTEARRGGAGGARPAARSAAPGPAHQYGGAGRARAGADADRAVADR